MIIFFSAEDDNNIEILEVLPSESCKQSSTSTFIQQVIK